MSDLPLEKVPDITEAAREAAGGEVVYLTDNAGERLAAIVPAWFADALERMPADELVDLAEELADAAAARAALDEMRAGAKPIPADQVWAELGV
jgi:uncharacterized protein with ATP-grasp and redox domains